MTRTLTIPGEPVAKGRPRVTNRGITYTPAKTKNYETLVQELYWAKYRGKDMLQGQLTMTIDAYFQIPKSASKKKREAMLRGEDRPTKRPDLDNCIKSIADALNGIAYQDDSYIVEVIARKWWAEQPLVEITIIELGGGSHAI